MNKPDTWTRVIWEETSPHGAYHPNVLREGVVIDSKYLDAESAFTLRYNSALVPIKSDNGKVDLVYWHKLVF